MQYAVPAYDIDDVVAYHDRQGRLQRGEVMAVEASWRGRPGRAPLIVYTVRHPTYANRRFYTTADDIVCRCNHLRNAPSDAPSTTEADQ